MSESKKRKVTVVGAGSVGSTFAYALAQSGLADEIAIVDAFPNFAEGQAMDLAQGTPFLPRVNIHAGTAADYADSDLVAVTAGAKQKPGETRIDLLRRNASIVSGIAREVAASRSRGVLLIVSNPVDILTKIALRASSWPRSSVIGSGTVLDTARFRYALARETGVDARNIHGYVLGEHGDSELAAWSLTHIAGQSFEDHCREQRGMGEAAIAARRDAVLEEVRQSAYHIIDYKGSTYYAIGLAMTRIASAILRDEKSILSVSVDLEGEFGQSGVCLSVPCIVGRGGVEKILSCALPPAEQEALAASGARLKSALAELGPCPFAG